MAPCLRSDERRARVTLVPETADVAQYFIAADIFVCTSRVESYPRIILEAMAWGLPIVTTPVFGIREQVREDVNRIFYEPRNVEALAAAISRLVANDELRERLAGSAVPTLDALTDFDSMVDQYGSIFIEAAPPSSTVAARGVAHVASGRQFALRTSASCHFVTHI